MPWFDELMKCEILNEVRKKCLTLFSARNPLIDQVFMIYDDVECRFLAC